MLYINRLVSGERYAVMDTDDGVETIVTYKELKNAVLKNKLDIKGVNIVSYPSLKATLGQQSGKPDRPRYSIEVSVYQPVEERSLKQVKNATVSGVNVIKNGDVVTGIKMTAIGQPVIVRLSDFGTKFDNYVFSKHPKSVQGLQLTLVFDDKIKCTARSFMYWQVFGNVDVTEVTDLRIINNIVSTMFKDHYAFAYIRDQMIARKETKDYIYGVMMLNGCQFNSYNTTMGGIDAVLASMSPEGVALVHQYCIKEFTGLGNCKFIFNGELHRLGDIAFHARSTVDFDSFEQWRDFIRDRENRYHSHLLQQLKVSSTLNNDMLTRLWNYLCYFEPAEPVKQEIIRFCCNAIKAIEQL